MSQKRPFLERQMAPGGTNVGITPTRLLQSEKGTHGFGLKSMIFCYSTWFMW